MVERPLRILQVNTSDSGGGAAHVAWELLRAYGTRGHECWMAVGEKRRNDAHVLTLPHEAPASLWWRIHAHAAAQRPPRLWLSRLARTLAAPHAAIDRFRGREDFHHPGTWRLIEMVQPPPDILHLHNLHGDYFDLRALPMLSGQIPTVVTLHDAWLLGGHCAHSLDCPRWATGCGECPDLALYPTVRRDATLWNWQRKRDIYRESNLHIAAPSAWLLKKVEGSILKAAARETRLIPNGIDLSVFHPGDAAEARRRLDLPQDASILLFVAKGLRQNRWKDYPTLRAAAERVATRRRDSLFLAVGESQADELPGIRFVPYREDPAEMARYYQAADLYIHAAHADTFPSTVLEALACGRPVVATAVGGIPEQIRQDETGILVPPADPEAMAGAILRLLDDAPLRRRMSDQAAQDARTRFDLNRQADDYLEWYREILRKRGGS